jgi:S-formylglutathione hydrolase FrmB
LWIVVATRCALAYRDRERRNPVNRQPQPGLPRVIDSAFRSLALARDMSYTILLPAGYDGSHQRFPVLYLLHGWNGDHTNWCTLTNLARYAQAYPFIIVTPDGQNSWYVNSATIPADRFYDYIASDLISAIDAQYRTLALPQHRAIAGLSMGGYGALLLALRQPQMFAAAASISGALDGPTGVENVLPDVRESTGRAYGAAMSATRSENDIFALVRTSSTPLPYMFLQCGIQDVLLPSNRRFAAELSSAGIPYEYHELPGDHTWDFWDSALPPLLQVIASRIVPAL